MGHLLGHLIDGELHDSKSYSQQQFCGVFDMCHINKCFITIIQNDDL